MQQSKLEIVKNVKETKTENLSSKSLFVRLSRAFDYIAILRPLLLIPGWTMVFLGYYRGIGNDLTTHINLPIIGNLGIILHPKKEILLTLVLYSLLMGAVYVLNQITDSHTDGINGKLYLIPHGYLKKSILKVQIAVLISIGVVLLVFIKFSLAYSVLVLLSIIMGIMYSVPPIRLKGKPILDLITNASGFGLVAFAVGWTARSEFSSNLILDSLPYFLCVSAAFINTTIPDIEGDIRNGDITIGVFLGARRACLFSTLILILAILAGWFRKDFVPITASVLSLPFFIRMTIFNWKQNSVNIKSITLATKVSIMALSLLVALLVPFYFILLVFTVLLTRLYYQVRFGISYP
jgi:4-hydroxybenzoate polyprenyltransferase